MGKGQAIAGLVCSIAAVVMYILGYVVSVLAIVALPLAIVGLVLSVVGGKKAKANGQKSGVATAGLVVGIIATVLSGIGFACAICVICAGAALLAGAAA